jgi:hypothetical protein
MLDPSREKMKRDLELLIGTELLAINVEYSAVKLVFDLYGYTTININKMFHFVLNNGYQGEFDAASGRGDPQFILLRGAVCESITFRDREIIIVFPGQASLQVIFLKKDFEPVIYTSTTTIGRDHHINFLHVM